MSPVVAFFLCMALVGLLLCGCVWHFRARRHLACFHHNAMGGWVTNQDQGATSWIEATLIETGMRKMFLCTRCGKVWFT